MLRKKPSMPGNEPATKGDVESIVTRVVSNLVPNIVNRIVDQKIDDFAMMVGRGFADTQAQINEFKSEMCEFKGETEQSLFCLQSDVTDLKGRMGKVETRMETFEGSVKTILCDHEARIVNLEGSSV